VIHQITHSDILDGPDLTGPFSNDLLSAALAGKCPSGALVHYRKH